MTVFNPECIEVCVLLQKFYKFDDKCNKALPVNCYMIRYKSWNGIII